MCAAEKRLRLDSFHDEPLCHCAPEIALASLWPVLAPLRYKASMTVDAGSWLRPQLKATVAAGAGSSSDLPDTPECARKEEMP